MPTTGTVQSLSFTGVAAYEFTNDAFGNIVNELVQVPALDLFREHRAELISSYQEAGSPGSWVLSPEAASQHITEYELWGFTLTSSVGLCGWLIAQGYSKAG